MIFPLDICIISNPRLPSHHVLMEGQTVVNVCCSKKSLMFTAQTLTTQELGDSAFTPPSPIMCSNHTENMNMLLPVRSVYQFHSASRIHDMKGKFLRLL